MPRAKATAAVSAAAVCIFAAAAASGFAAKRNSDLQPRRNTSAAEIVLPPQIETEKPATLAVLDGEGRLLPGVNVDLSQGQRVTTDSTGRARFVVTSAAGQFTAQATLGGARATTEVIPNSSASPTEVTISQSPRFTELGGRIIVRGGGFRGDADINIVTIDGLPALVLAASPVSLVVLPGASVVPGAASLEIDVAGRKCNPVTLTFVSLSVEPQAIPIVEGKNNHLILSVRGTDKKLMLAVENRTPDVIELAGGNIQRIMTNGGRRNVAVIEMRALRATDFSVVVKLAAERQ
jgi:hypothetical protein